MAPNELKMYAGYLTGPEKYPFPSATFTDPDLLEIKKKRPKYKPYDKRADKAKCRFHHIRNNNGGQMNIMCRK